MTRYALVDRYDSAADPFLRVELQECPRTGEFMAVGEATYAVAGVLHVAGGETLLIAKAVKLRKRALF